MEMVKIHLVRALVESLFPPFIDQGLPYSLMKNCLIHSP